LWDLLRAPFRGFESAAAIIAFVLLVGGGFALVMATGAIDAALIRLIRITGESKRAKGLMLTFLMLIFSACGFTFGMSEESLVFVLFTIPLARSMGYDTITGVAIPFVTSGVGGAAAAYSPFSVGVAMKVSGIPFPSGEEIRFVLWIILTAITIAFILWYAARVARNPESGLLHGFEDKFQHHEVGELTLTARRKIVVFLFLAALIAIPFGASQWNWEIAEIGGLFLALGLVSAVVTRMSASNMVREFTAGCSGMLTAALVICISRAVLVVARDGQIIDTILNGLASAIHGMPAELSIQLMFLIQGVINFFVPSGSGQAAITMPVMAPLADLLGISRDHAVLAFQLAAGYFDLVIPTSGVTMGVLSLAGIPFSVWLKWMWKLMLILVLVAMIAMAVVVNQF
jgi:uncharacterized ion transporter superfamily protein YfcC